MVIKRLKHARKVRGLKQKELAQRIGLDGDKSTGTLSAWETGRSQPPYRIMVKLAGELKFPVGYFYIEEDYLAETVLRIYENRFNSIENPYAGAVEEVEMLRKELREKDSVILRIRDLVDIITK